MKCMSALERGAKGGGPRTRRLHKIVFGVMKYESWVNGNGNGKVRKVEIGNNLSFFLEGPVIIGDGLSLDNLVEEVPDIVVSKNGRSK